MPEVTLPHLVPDPRSELPGMEEDPARPLRSSRLTRSLPHEAPLNPFSSRGALTILWLWHLPHRRTPVHASASPNTCGVWEGLGRQGWCPAHRWAPGGGASEQLMNAYLLPR